MAAKIRLYNNKLIFNQIPDSSIIMDQIDSMACHNSEDKLQKMRPRSKARAKATKVMIDARKRINVRNLWRTALSHMPYNSIQQVARWSGRIFTDQVDALAICLDIKANRILPNILTGALPRNQLSRDILEKLASDAYGEQMAAIRLASKGLLARYPYWPSQPVKKRTRGQR